MSHPPHGNSYGIPPEHLISAEMPGGAPEVIEEEDLAEEKGGQDELINEESLCFDFAERQKH